MPRPGTQITLVDDAPPPAGAILDTGQAFFVGTSQRGPTVEARRVYSLADYQKVYGLRSGGSLLYDAAYCFFSEGGSSLIVGRAIGSGGAVATISVPTSVKIDAANPGAWGNLLKVVWAAAVPSGITATVVETPAGGVATTVESYPRMTTVDEIITAFSTSAYLKLTKLGATMPAASTSQLAGGVDGGAVGAPELATALALFTYAMGPGQVAAPGLTSTASQLAVMAHCDTMRRVALLDAIDDPDQADLVTAIDSIQGQTGIRYTSLWAPWALYPAQSGGAILTVPWSPIQAALISINDRLTGNPNDAAAGVSGVSRLALGLSQFYSDTVRQALNAEGVDLAQIKYGQVRAYGYRTAAGPTDPNWTWLGNARVITALAHEFDAVAEKYVLRQIDGKHVLFAKLETDLRGVCKRYFDLGAFYGETPEEAFSVNTSQTVNTPATIAAGEVHAVVRVRCSPTAEWVEIQVVKVPIERPV
jgi:hypothetical protein